MDRLYIYISIAVMALITYAIRALPLLVFKKPITNNFFRSFLYYAPYVTLSVLAFPAVLYCTDSLLISSVALICSIIITLVFGNFVLTTFCGCMVVFLLELLVG